MVSGPDIITYIGVPLAVLGVLPIIYNTITTLAHLAKIRRILRHSRLDGITRGDVINHVIEVELPRYTLQPLHRQDQHKDYWRLCEYPSHLPGGSWTIFNWRTNAIGSKTQRIDYSDQLRQPQAEIEFEELVSFLLDLGAVPDQAGFRMLRASGLWVPTGTPLLLSPDRHEKVLCIGPLDDSDGLLSLSVRWSSNWAMRDHTHLPPYWVLIKGLPPSRPFTKIKQTGQESPIKERDTSIIETNGDSKSEEKAFTSRYIPVDITDAPPTIRCQVGLDGLTAAIPDDFDAQMFDSLSISHLSSSTPSTSSIGVWVASAITALGTTSQNFLWNYKIPSPTLQFAKTASIPCGILVLMDMVEESATPEWATQYDDAEEERLAAEKEQREVSRAMMKEIHLRGEDWSRAVQERQKRMFEERMEQDLVKERRTKQRKEQRRIEALQSPKWSNKLVAEHSLAWLRKEGHVEPEEGLERTVEVLIWKIINDMSFAEAIGRVLDDWKAFVDGGGMRKADFAVIVESQVMFAFATLVVALLEGSVEASQGSLAMDLQECMRIWKKVRLG